MSSSRILIVEDDAMLSMLLEQIILESGYEDIELAFNVPMALEAVRTKSFDLAFLDVNLGDDTSFPVAHALEAKGTPYYFITGYGSKYDYEGLDDPRIIKKPYASKDIKKALSETLAS